MSQITEKMVDQSYSDLKDICGGVRDDYFGICYLESEFDMPRSKSVNQIAFGGNDYGLDGFHFDVHRRNLYLFQFKNSTSASQFRVSFERLISKGMERLFVSPNQDDAKNQVLLRLWSGLIENRHAIDQVYFRFVFKGKAEEAERSQVLDKLREDLEGKKHYIDHFFGDRNVTFIVEFRSTAGGVTPPKSTKSTHVFTMPISETISQAGPKGETMTIGMVNLIDLHRIHADMSERFFARNIRYGLGGTQSVNRVLTRAFKSIAIEGEQSPTIFAYNHNGITIFAEKIEPSNGSLRITEPRLLNGAQTVTSFSDFLKANSDNPKLKDRQSDLERIQVLCRFITGASEIFVTAVTINNNRQNPVAPWNLRANEVIQLELQDRFREIGIYYERQENAFKNLSFDQLEVLQAKPITLLGLAQTFLVSDGHIDRLSRMREVFEDDRVFRQVFNENRKTMDLRLAVLCYKIQFRLRKLLKEIADKGPNKYWYINRARNLLWALLCQAVLNDNLALEWADLYGERMSLEAQYTSELAKLSTTRCRPLISELVADPTFSESVAKQNLNFLRSNTAYKRCMDIAYRKWKWVEKRLK